MTHFLYSPNRHFQLTELEGNPDVIEERGQYYKKVAVQLKEVSVELDALAKRDKYRSEALDEIRESSGVLAADLDKVEDRYAAAGPVLEDYAKALRRAQNTTVDPLVPQIQTAHASAADADAAQRAAQRELDGLEHVWPWEDQPTSTEMRTARNTLSTASTAAVNAAASLNELWVSFESGYSSWESSYETAVNGLQRANDASGVNDEWWEDALDFIATAAGIIAAVVVIVALFVAAPIAAVLLVIATVASIIALVATIGLAIANPRKANGWDIALAAIGVVPFLGAFAKGLKGGVKPMESLIRASGFRTATRGSLDQGRNAVFLDLRSIRGAGGQYGGQAARITRASTVADDFTSNVLRSRFSNYWNAIRSGGARDDGIALTMSQHMTSRWPGGASGNRVANWVGGIDQPGWAMSTINTFNFVNGSLDAGSDVNATIRSGSLW